MASGYDLIYERLWRHERTRTLVAGLEAALRTFRASDYRFRLQLASDAPPELRTEWRVISSPEVPGVRPLDCWVDFRYGDAPDVWSLATDKVVDHDAFRRVAADLYPDDAPHKWSVMPEVREGQIPRTYPCSKEVVLGGRRHGERGGERQSFAAWCLDRVRTRSADAVEARRKTVRHRANAESESLPFRAAHDRALEDLAVEELAQRMVHFSKIPNVIERASKLFVVKDVMEG